MQDTRITRWWLALTGVSQLGMAAVLAVSGPTWASIVLAVMGVVTIAGGIAQARSVR